RTVWAPQGKVAAKASALAAVRDSGRTDIRLILSSYPENGSAEEMTRGQDRQFRNVFKSLRYAGPISAQRPVSRAGKRTVGEDFRNARDAPGAAGRYLLMPPMS